MSSNGPAYILAAVTATFGIVYHFLFVGKSTSWIPFIIFGVAWLVIVFGVYSLFYETNFKPFYE